MSCELKAILSSKTLTVELQGTFAGSGECADGTVNIVNSEDTLLYSKDVASGETAEQLVADQTAEGTTGLGAIFFPAGTTGTIPDVEYTDTDGSPATAPYGSAIACSTPADGTVEIKNSADTLLYTVEVGSGDTEEQVIPDQSAQGTTGQGAITFPANTTGTIPDVEWTDSDGTDKTTPYGEDILAKLVSDYTPEELNAVIPYLVKEQIDNVGIFKTGETVSYETGDDGDVQLGRGATWGTRTTLNQYGTLLRWQPIFGGDIIHDTVGGLLWYNSIEGNMTTTQFIAAADALTSNGISNWYMPNFNQAASLFQQTSVKSLVTSIGYDQDVSGAIIFMTSSPYNEGSPATNVSCILLLGGDQPELTLRGRTAKGDVVVTMYCKPISELPDGFNLTL